MQGGIGGSACLRADEIGARVPLEIPNVPGGDGHCSYRCRVTENLFPHAVAEASRRNHIYPGSQQLLRIPLQTTQVEQAASRLEVDKKIDIAVGIVLTPRYRTKNAQIPGPSPRGETQDFGTLRVTEFLDRHSLSLKPRGRCSGRGEHLLEPPGDNLVFAGSHHPNRNMQEALAAA